MNPFTDQLEICAELNLSTGPLPACCLPYAFVAQATGWLAWINFKSPLRRDGWSIRVLSDVFILLFVSVTLSTYGKAVTTYRENLILQIHESRQLRFMVCSDVNVVAYFIQGGDAVLDIGSIFHTTQSFLSHLKTKLSKMLSTCTKKNKRLRCAKQKSSLRAGIFFNFKCSMRHHHRMTPFDFLKPDTFIYCLSPCFFFLCICLSQTDEMTVLFCISWVYWTSCHCLKWVLWETQFRLSNTPRSVKQ